MDTPEEQMKKIAEAVVQIFRVFSMFGFKAGDDLRLGSFMHLVEVEGPSRDEVNMALAYLMERELLQPNPDPGVRPGGFVLTTEGEATMRRYLAADSE